MIDLNTRKTAQQRGWGEPGVSRDDLVELIFATEQSIPMRVRKEVAWLFQELVYGLIEIRRAGRRSPLTSSGGYNKRFISGTTVWSNHSWALAGDFNAGANPYAYGGSTDFPIEQTRALAHAYGFRWGYDYTGKQDAMHFEFMGTPEDARVLTEQLQKIRKAVMSAIDELLPEGNHYTKNPETLGWAIREMEFRIVQQLQTMSDASEKRIMAAMALLPAQFANELLNRTSGVETWHANGSVTIEKVRVQEQLSRAAEGSIVRHRQEISLAQQTEGKH